MRLIYKPIGIVIGVLAGLVGKRVFNAIWGLFDEEEPPGPTTQVIPWPKLILAAAMQGMIYRLVRVFVDRGLAKVWASLTGVWPGERRPQRT